MPRYSSTDVFLNIPYDARYAPLLLALISGLCAFGLTPRATLEIPESERRLNKIFDLIRKCKYSFHDLSRIEIDKIPPRTPRFNMPFELGLMLGWALSKKTSHRWFVLESIEHRLLKSLSDLNGTDPKIHRGTPQGVFAMLTNTFSKPKHQPTVQHMQQVYRELVNASSTIMRRAGTRSVFAPRVFRELVVLATAFAERTMPRR